MTQSMTAFATRSFVLYEKESARITVSMNLKTLNARYFETNFRLSHALGHLETAFIKLFKEKLRRGSMHFQIHLSNSQSLRGTVTPSLAVVKGYIQAAHAIKKETGINGELAINDLLLLPNIFSLEEHPLDVESTSKILAETKELIEKVVAERMREGETLAADLAQRSAILAREMVLVEERSKEHVAEYQKKIHDLTQSLIENDAASTDTRKSLLYAMLDKIDIHEEVVRFKSNLDSFNACLKSSEFEKGKRLDFILQELTREINTIAAKCSDAQISISAIAIKVEIEKAREQVQNIV